ncbi:drug/metabolite transporter (DMT)-like permease [Angulomicrobium tetraedrale]|uniref:Drug/metabolite transporter (DMT)-like permease n=1 Tax=Ancylobacter tetraedralis TaxID=217068 RepID=A0A839Z764_9HYPH|nr:EamA family transporter [Ancylobacter tetraedralis]MBB3769875.1 drug/metabolite transporter (DMT)-like permease [Ancylobacter tetraedralis]
MDLSVFLAVIAAAAMHAGWNAILKIRLDPFIAVVLVNAACGLIALPVALWLGPPEPHLWPWIIASILIHLVYYLTLSGAYRLADMGLVYPLARGSAPLLTTLLSVTLVGEAIDAQGFLGVVVLALGILAIAWRRKGLAALDGRALRLALACGVSITAYTLVDGLGARSASSPHMYTSWLFVMDSLVITIFGLAWKGPRALKPALSFIGPGFAGGAMSLAAYWISIWAMTRAPIGLVAAVRESSVLFAAVIAVVVLHEPLRRERLVSAALIVAGLVLIKLH